MSRYLSLGIMSEEDVPCTSGDDTESEVEVVKVVKKRKVRKGERNKLTLRRKRREAEEDDSDGQGGIVGEDGQWQESKRIWTKKAMLKDWPVMVLVKPHPTDPATIGLALIAQQHCPKDNWLTNYGGELVKVPQDAKKKPVWSQEDLDEGADCYSIQVNYGMYCYPTRSARKLTAAGHMAIGWCANHSLQPNAAFWHDACGLIFLYAIRDIAAGEEVTVDYRWDDYPPHFAQL